MILDRPGHQILDRFEAHGATVAFPAGPKGDLVRFHFPVPDDQHRRDLLQLRLANLEANLFLARVDPGPP